MIPSLSTQAQPSSRAVNRLVDQIRSQRVAAIFPESSLNPKIEKAVARESGAQVGGALWADTLGPEGLGRRHLHRLDRGQHRHDRARPERRPGALPMSADHQALIVGGGAAGLSAALVLGRARVDTLLVDAGEPSNLAAPAIGGLLGQHETAPGSLYAAGREQLAELPSVTVADDTVTALAAGFTATLADGGAVGADRVVLATGMHYQRPERAGHRALLGRRGLPLPLLPRLGAPRRPAGGAGRPRRGPPRAAAAPVVRRRGRAGRRRGATRTASALDEAGIPVDERPVAAFEGDGARLNAVRFADGSRARARRRDGGRAAAPARRPRPAAGLRDHRHADRHRASWSPTPCSRPRSPACSPRATCRRRCSRWRWPSRPARWPPPRCTARSSSP